MKKLKAGRLTPLGPLLRPDRVHRRFTLRLLFPLWLPVPSDGLVAVATDVCLNAVVEKQDLPAYTEAVDLAIVEEAVDLPKADFVLKAVPLAFPGRNQFPLRGNRVIGEDGSFG